MANLNGFDAYTIEPLSDFEPLPAGKYLAAVTESEFKETRAGDGEYLQLTFSILDGPHKGRLVWARLNLKNPNQTAMQIAQRELSALCRAIGVMQPKDSSELHNTPLTIKVACRKRDDSDEITNVIKGYERAGGIQPPASQAPAAPRPTPQSATPTPVTTAAAPSTAPWAR